MEKPKIDYEKITRFEEAFDSGGCGCVRLCSCGKTYYDSYNGGYTWEDGEYEVLEKNKNAFPLNYAVGEVVFEGKSYVNGCNCWHERAMQIIRFIDSHIIQIANYINSEKEILKQQAEIIPEVKT